ncbi:unnamed protein product, partial [Closterium sp. NIES-54]
MTLRQEVLGNLKCDRRKSLLDEKEGHLKEYQTTRRERRHLMAGLNAELLGEISGKQLSLQLKVRRWRTQIMELEVAGSLVAAASDFFSRIFSVWMEEEVKAAFKAMANNKSPGMDGLPKELFENNWDLLRGSFMSLVKDFTTSEMLPSEVKGAVMILLHKKGDKSQLGNYRPITLLNFTYKILAKVLADRLKGMLHQVVSPEQYV